MSAYTAWLLAKRMVVSPARGQVVPAVVAAVPATSTASAVGLATPRVGRPASMKKGAARGNCSAWAMAATSRENQRCSAGSLLRKKPPLGSVMRTRPCTVAGAASTLPAHSARWSCGMKPRFTSTWVPSPCCSALMTQKPEPRAVTAWVSTVLPGSHWPVRVTGRYSCPAWSMAGQSAGRGRATGAA